MASTLRKTLPLRVTATGFATHVVEVPGFSKVRKRHRGDSDTGYVCSETFTVDGLDWMVVCHLGEVGDEQGYMGAFLELVTEGVAVWAHFSLGLVDWATGCAADAFFSDEDPMLFDAGNDDCCNWGTDKLASWTKDLRGSGRRYLRRDCLRIECVVDICHFRLAFRDPPAPKFTPLDVAAVGTLGSEEGADVLIHVGAGDPIPAHSSVLEAYAPRFLKKHNAGRRRRAKTTTPTRVNVDDMPRLAVEALLQFAYNGSLPIVDGLSGDGYRDMFRHLLLAAKRYGMRRLSAICERVLCRCVDVDTAAATLAMARRHGFQKLEEACIQFASHPVSYGLVRKSKGYGELLCSWETFCVERDLRAKYCERSEQQPRSASAAGKRSWGSLLTQYFARARCRMQQQLKGCQNRQQVTGFSLISQSDRRHR